MKFLAVAVPQKIVLFLWAPKPYYKFMTYKEFPVPFSPTKIDLTIKNGDVLSITFASSAGFHQIDASSGAVLNLYIPRNMPRGGITPVAILHPSSRDSALILLFNEKGIALDHRGDVLDGVDLTWGEVPSSAGAIFMVSLF